MPVIEKCCKCLNFFSMIKLPRKLPNCSHSICEPCLRDIIDTKQEIIICGFCSTLIKKADIRIFSLNTTLLLGLSESPSPRLSQPIQNREEFKNLGPTVTPSQDQESQQLCPTHKVSMDIICISDKQKICPHCALFGKHRDHRIKRIDDFQKEISQKRKAFEQIQKEKQIVAKKDGFKISESLKKQIQLKKAQLLIEIDQQAKRYIDLIIKAKQKTFQEIKSVCSEFESGFSGLNTVSKLQKNKVKFGKWETTCLEAMDKIDKSLKIQQKLYVYYESPLELVTQGFIFLEQLNKYSQQSFKRLKNKIKEIQLDKQVEKAFNIDNFFRIKRGSFSPNASFNKTYQQQSQINPFLDCTSSEIMIGQNTLLHNTSLEADISSISKQIKGEKSMISLPKKQLQLKAVKSLDKDKSRASIHTQKTIIMPKTPSLKRPSSQILNFNLSPRAYKSATIKQIIPQTQCKQETKPFEIRQPEKIYQQFVKNTLTDFFDISECNLPSDKVVQYVHRAKRVHRMKGLKLCNNRLTAVGFEKMTQYLQGVSNINLANNNINQEIFDAIFHNRDKLESLKMINLSHNPITLDKKATMRVQDIKRCGIIVIL